MDFKIRNAIEQFSDAGIIPDWQQLERRLDIDMPVKKKRRRFIAFWIVLASLSGGVSFLWYSKGHNYDAHNPRVTKMSTHSNHSATAPQVLSEVNETSGNLFPVQDKINEKQFFIGNSTFDTKDKKYKTQSVTLPASLFKREGTKNNTRVQPLDDLAVYDTDDSEKINATDYFTIEESKKPTANNSHSTTDDVFNKGNITSGLQSDSNATASSKSQDDSLVEKSNLGSKTKSKSKLNSKITLTLSGGTNINSVQLNKPSKAGFDYGLLLGYRFSQSFEIRAGVILSKKYFKTSGKNLSFDSAKLNLPSYNSIMLEDATGYCRFIEIPVMLYYRFPASKKTNFYAAGGFSVNKMRMENIDYTFVADGSTVIERSHANAYHNNSGFSTSLTSNFSIGISRKINKTWNLSVESYSKIPLTRFNDNNLRFSTFGMSLSASYNLPAKRKK